MLERVRLFGLFNFIDTLGTLLWRVKKINISWLALICSLRSINYFILPEGEGKGIIYWKMNAKFTKWE